MVQRRATGQPARITFTGDFHELLTGDLCRGQPLSIAYDPARIVPADAPIRCGEPDRPVTLHARFRAADADATLPLGSPAGIVAKPVGAMNRHGCFVTGSLAIPGDAEIVSLWFTYADHDGHLRRDDDDGATYRFRFPCQDLTVERTAVIRLPGDDDAAFAVEVTSVPEVERVRVRYRLLAFAGWTSGEVDLVAATEPSGRKRWTNPPQPVPATAIVRFKLFYWVGGVRFKDDDGGQYYVAPDPDGDPIPSPPAALIEAARSWVP